MPESPNFYTTYLGTACVGDGRARIPLVSVLTGVIVGQGQESRKNKRSLDEVHLLSEF